MKVFEVVFYDYNLCIYILLKVEVVTVFHKNASSILFGLKRIHSWENSR